MATLENLTTADIKKVVKSKSMSRARGYVGNVRQAARNGRSLRAEVGKSRSYSIEIDVLDDGIHAICSCPYDWGGYCKHIGAVLLKWIEQPGSFVIEMPASTNSDFIIETFVVEAPKTAVSRENPYWIKKTHTVRRQNDDDNLRIWLGEYKVKDLRRMARRNGWPIKGTRKADLIQQLMSHMLQPGIALQSLLNLDAEHRQVYDAMGLFYTGIRFQTKHITALANLWGSLTQYKNVDTYFSRLCNVGLAIPGNFESRYWQQITFIPSSIMRIMPPLLADRVTEVSLSDDVNSGVVMGGKRPFLQRLHQVLLLLEQSSPPMRQPMPRPRLEKFHDMLKEWDYIPEEVRDAQSKKKLKSYDPDFSLTVPPPLATLPDEAIQRLAPIAGDEVQLNFIYHLLTTTGLLRQGSPVTVWREVKNQFLRYDEAGQSAILARAYFALDTWSEVWMMLAKRPSLQLKRSQKRYQRIESPSEMYRTLAVFREQVLQLLAGLPDNQWYSVRDVTNLLRPLWLRFDSWAWSNTNRYGETMADWFLADDGTPLDTTKNEADWDKAQGAFIQQMIQGPLHWLGLTDISVENGRLTAFRLHGLGDLFLDKVESVPLAGSEEGAVTKEVNLSAAADAITVDGTAIIVDPTAVAAQAHNYLDGIAVLEEAGTTRFIYQLNVDAVHQAFESGKTLDEMVSGWEKWFRIPIPPAIHDQLTVWQKAYGQVRLYEKVTVIEFGDEYALREMKAATSLNKHLVAEISPTLVIIPANKVDLLATELEKAGYTPKKTNKV